MPPAIPPNRRVVVPDSPNMAGLGVLGVVLALAAGCSNFVAQGRNAAGARLCDQAQYYAALREFQEATYAEPNNPDGYYNLAARYHRLGQLEKNPSYLD